MINNYYDLLFILVKNRKTIIWMTLSFSMLAVVASLILPVRYKATATLMPPVSQGSSLMSLVTRTNIMADPEIGGTGFMPGMVTPSDVFAYMLKSGPVADIVIRECGLVEHYKEAKTFSKKPEKALYGVAKRLGEATKIKVTEERFITISVEDKDKVKAAEIANKYGEALDRIYSKMTMTQGGKMREFIGKRVDQELALLRQTEDSLKAFQQKYRTVSITDEMKAVIEMSATLDAKIMGQQIELDAIKSYSSPDNAQVNVLENQVRKSKEELDNLISGNKGKTLFIPMAKAPAIGLRLTQLMRDVRIHQELFGLLIQQMEQAKILEAKDTPKVQYLEKASPPFIKVWPKRKVIVLFGLLIGLVCSFLTVMAKEQIHQLSVPGEIRNKWLSLREHLLI